MKPALLKVDVGLSLLCFIVSLTSLKVQKKIPDHISTPGLDVLTKDRTSLASAWKNLSFFVEFSSACNQRADSS